MFCCEYCVIFKNKYFEKHLTTATPGFFLIGIIIEGKFLPSETSNTTEAEARFCPIKLWNSDNHYTMAPNSCLVEVQYSRDRRLEYYANLLILIKSANQFTHNSKGFIELSVLTIFTVNQKKKKKI